MKTEVDCAAQFLASLVRRGARDERQVDAFTDKLCELLTERYQQHWHPARPERGSAYRCIRINHQLDPLVSQAAAAAGWDCGAVYRLLPSELTLWVDPCDVSYRIGEDGSVCDLDLPTASDADLSSDSGSETEYEMPLRSHSYPTAALRYGGLGAHPTAYRTVPRGRPMANPYACATAARSVSPTLRRPANISTWYNARLVSSLAS